MRLTVGPLAPAVYWRRRALVAGAAAAVVALGFILLSGGSSGGGSGQDRSAGTPPGTASNPGLGAGGSSTGSVPTSSSPTRPPSGSPDPAGRPDEPSASAMPGPTTIPVGGDIAMGSGPGDPVGPCSDSDLALTAGIHPSPGVYGGTFALSLVVQNASAKSCTRDIGSGAQEVRVLRAGAAVWSSDACGSSQDSDVRTFPPGAGVRFTIQWSSYRTAPDPCRLAAQPAPEGSYQVVARLGGMLSAPVSFDIVR